MCGQRGGHPSVPMHQEIEKKERAQYSEAVHTLNKKLTAKTTTLVKGTHQCEEAEKAKTNLATKLTTFRKHMQKAKANAVAELCVSQYFFNACGVYYSVKFNDCLNQVGAAYLISYRPERFLSSPVLNLFFLYVVIFLLFHEISF